MFNKHNFVTAMVLLSVILISSGTAVCDDEKGDVRGYLMIGSPTFDIDGLNEKLTGKGYSEMSDTFYSLGGGGFANVSDRFMFGFEGQLFFNNKETSTIGTDTYASRIIGGYGLLNTGYLAVKNDHLDLYPVIGIGVGGMRYNIVQTSFDSILDNPHGNTNIATYSFLLNFALGTEYKFKISGDDNEKSFFTIGLRGGYLYAPFETGWYNDEFGLSGAPDGGINGPYICLTIGGSGQKTFKQIQDMFDD